MDELPRCHDCGAPLPCSCGTEGRATFTLLPAFDDEMFVEEERFTRLLREVKRDVLKREFVEDAHASRLARKADSLDRAVRQGEFSDADEIAEDMVDSVLEFPRPPKAVRLVESPLLLVVVGASVLMATIVAILVFARG